MRILGIDPGIGIIGFGVINVDSAGQFTNANWGVIKTTPNTSDSPRLKEIYHDLSHLLSEIQPDVVSVEKIFFFRNTTTIIPVTQARGVILLAIEEQNLPLYEYTPLQVKQSLTGHGRAKKPEVRETMMQLLSLEKKPTPDDAADALAIAICHYFNNR